MLQNIKFILELLLPILALASLYTTYRAIKLNQEIRESYEEEIQELKEEIDRLKNEISEV